MDSWLSYSPAEARVLEDHYIAGYKREGLWGAGKAPKDKPPPSTAAGFKRTAESKGRRERILKLIGQGFCTVTAIKDKTRIHDSTIRKHIRLLSDDRLIEMIGMGDLGEKIWRRTTP
jgi:DNA-binding transcriptional ArsR family regulator